MVKKDDMNFVINVRLSTVNQPSHKKIEKEHGCILGGLSIYIVIYNSESIGGHDGRDS